MCKKAFGSIRLCYGLLDRCYDALVCDLGAEVKVGEVVKVDPEQFDACIHLSQVRVLCGCVSVVCNTCFLGNVFDRLIV